MADFAHRTGGAIAADQAGRDADRRAPARRRPRHGGAAAARVAWQPAIELEIDPEGVFSIGANIDRDHLTIVAVDAVGRPVRGRIHHEARFQLPMISPR